MLSFSTGLSAAVLLETALTEMPARFLRRCVPVEDVGRVKERFDVVVASS